MKNRIPYAERLKDPRWQKKRLEILSRDNFTCLHCDSQEKTLHVHHTYYNPNGNPWEVDSKCLKTLCEDCHKVEDGEFERLTRELIGMIKEAGLTSCDLPPMLYEIRKTYLGHTFDGR